MQQHRSWAWQFSCFFSLPAFLSLPFSSSDCLFRGGPSGARALTKGVGFPLNNRWGRLGGTLLVTCTTRVAQGEPGKWSPDIKCELFRAIHSIGAFLGGSDIWIQVLGKWDDSRWPRESKEDYVVTSTSPLEKNWKLSQLFFISSHNTHATHRGMHNFHCTINDRGGRGRKTRKSTTNLKDVNDGIRWNIENKVYINICIILTVPYSSISGVGTSFFVKHYQEYPFKFWQEI